MLNSGQEYAKSYPQDYNVCLHMMSFSRERLVVRTFCLWSVLILLSVLFFIPSLSSVLPSFLSSSSDRKKLLYKVRSENLYTKGQTLLIITVFHVR